MPAEKSSFSVNNFSQQPLASYIATSQIPVMDLNSNISSALPPKIKNMRTGLELTTHEVDRIVSLRDKKRPTKREDVPISHEIFAHLDYSPRSRSRSRSSG